MKVADLALLPPANVEPNDLAVREWVAASHIKVAVLDDDPTGTQTVHGVDVLASWSVEMLTAALLDGAPCFYVLTNTRSLEADQAAKVVREVAANLAAAGELTGVRFSIVSRGDSTLRGHFARELKAIESGLGVTFDATFIVPAFFEGGRYTIDNVHYVADQGTLVPAAETEFARDRTFGYKNSRLPEWIEEKTAGAVPAASVVSIHIGELRSEAGSESLQARILGLPKGAYVVVNAAAYSDLDVFTRSLLGAETAGKRYLVRSAASFVRVRAGLEGRNLLNPTEIAGEGSGPGLIVVGSYVGKTTAQLQSLLELPGVVGTEMVVDRLGRAPTRSREVARVAAAAEGAIGAGKHAVVFTSRARDSAVGSAGELTAGSIVSEALVDVVRLIANRPRFLLTKGGITSSDIAIRSLGMTRAKVLGQASSGVPVWEMGTETRFPGMRLVIWPGNVGDLHALRDFVRKV
jgi:uncharacterized protein YgbK (DUF1537 family)